MYLEVYPQVLGVSTLKRCPKCGEYKPADRDHFSGDKSRFDGLETYCKVCKKQYILQYRELHADAIRDQRRQNYQENAESNRLRARKYRENNPNVLREYMRERRNTIEGKREKQSAYQRRRARKLNLPNTLTGADWQFALDYFGGCCAACGRPPGLWHTLAADHWIPISRGGPSTPDNIVPLCNSGRDGVGGCNNSKHNTLPSDWLIEKFGPRKGRAIQRKIEAFLESRKSAEG